MRRRLGGEGGTDGGEGEGLEVGDLESFGEAVDGFGADGEGNLVACLLDDGGESVVAGDCRLGVEREGGRAGGGKVDVAVAQ